MAVCPYCRQPPLVASYDTLEEAVAELYYNCPTHGTTYMQNPKSIKAGRQPTLNIQGTCIKLFMSIKATIQLVTKKYRHTSSSNRTRWRRYAPYRLVEFTERDSIATVNASLCDLMCTQTLARTNSD